MRYKDSKTNIQNEWAIKPLIDAAYSETWGHALKILFIGGPLLSFSETIPTPFLISFDGDETGTEKFRDLFQAKASSEIIDLISPLIEKFMPKIITIISQENIHENDEDRRKVVALFVQSVINSEDLSRYSEIFGEILVKGLFSFSSALTSSIFKILYDKWRMIVDNTLQDEDDYKTMLEELEMMKFIEAQLRVSICGQCGNFQLALPGFINEYNPCPQCGNEWGSLTLYKFKDEYASLKANRNNDLPVFIASLLRHKLMFESAISQVELETFKAINGENGTNAEIDLWIPTAKIGIECKVFEEWNFPLTKNRLGSIAGEIKNQIERYNDAKIKKMYIFTNLSGEALEKIEARIKDLKPKRDNIDEIVLFGREQTNFFDGVDSVQKEISKVINQNFGKMIDNMQIDHKELKDAP